MIGDCQHALSVQHFVPGPACVAHRLPAKRSQPRHLHSSRPLKGAAPRPSFHLFAAADPRGDLFSEPGELPAHVRPVCPKSIRRLRAMHLAELPSTCR